MQIPEVTAEEAKRLLDGDEGYVYLDVRTIPEFHAGRAPEALNIPIAQVNPATGQMEFDPQFLSRVESKLAKNEKIIVGCKAGPRSEAACQLMLEAGFANVYNMLGGFSGVTDATGQVLVEGWSTLGYPTERGEVG